LLAVERELDGGIAACRGVFYRYSFWLMAECVFDPGAVAGVEHDERACRFLLSCRGLACDGYEVKLCGLRSLAHQLLSADKFLEVKLRSKVD